MSEGADSFRFLVGVGGIGSGMFLGLAGNDTLGRNESRAGRMLQRRDFCKLHIVAHYVAVLTGRGGGVTVLPIGKIGRDPAGAGLIEDMRRAGIDTRFVTVEPDAPTLFSVCFTYPDGDGGNITTDDSASARVIPGDVESAVAAIKDPGGGIALAVPEAPLPARARLLELGRQHGWLTAAAITTGEVPEALSSGMLGNVDLLGVNRDEAATIAGMDAHDDIAAIARAAGEKLAEVSPAIRLCVTAGAAGAIGWSAGRMESVPAAPVEVVNTAGAGDATLSALVVATAAGLPFIDPDRPRREALADAPLATALDLAALVSGLAVAGEDTINFDVDAEAVRQLARRIGADASALAPALEWIG